MQLGLLVLTAILMFKPIFSNNSPFQWDDENTNGVGLEQEDNPIQSSPPPPHPWSSQTPVPAPQRPLPPAQWDRSDPFYHMHQRMEEMNRRMDEVFSQLFSGFNGGRSPGSPSSFFQNFQKRFANPPTGSPLQPPKIGGLIKIEEKKDFVVVELPAESKSIDAYDVQVQGQVLRIERKVEKRNESQQDSGFKSFASLSTSVQSTLLPVPVELDFTKSIVKDKLVLVFKKKL